MKQQKQNQEQQSQSDVTEEQFFIKQLRQTCMVFNLIDPRYEKDKFIMKELNTLDYLVSLLEYMIKKKINYQTKTVAEFLLAFAQQKYHIENDVSEQVKSFITSLLYSYGKNSNNSAELQFIRRFLDDNERRSIATVQFYLKLRKLIVTNFLPETRKSLNTLLDGQVIKFEDWSTLVTRFLGANNISVIGTKVKEHNVKTKVYDKILQNSIDACLLIEFCLDVFEKTQPEPFKVQLQKPENILQPLMDQEQSQRKLTSKDNGSHQLVQNLSPQNDPQQKVIANLHEQKYKLLDEKLKQTVVFNHTLKMHENLADSYNNLAQYTRELQQTLAQVQQKLRKGQTVNEGEHKNIDKMLEFNDFLPEDPKQELLQSGIYEFIKG